MRSLLLGLLILMGFQALALKPITRAEAERRLEYFEYKENGELLELKEKKKRKNHTLYIGSLKVHDHTLAKSDTLSFKYYKSKMEGKRPLVMIMPSIRGETFLETDTARYFAHRGFHAIIARLNEDISDVNRDSSQVDNFLIRTTTQVRQIMDWAISTGDIDSSKIASFGVSLGGIRAALLSTVEPRIKGAALFVAGGDLPEVISRSSVKMVEEYRAARIEKEGLGSVEEYKEKLEDIVEIDPLHFSYRRNKEDFYLVMGNKDKKVPTAQQYELWEAFDRPKAVAYNMGHMGTALMYKFQLKKIRKYFQARLGVESEKKEGEFKFTVPKNIHAALNY